MQRVNGTHGNGVTLALTYVRVSSDEQANSGISLPAQVAEARRYASERGWIIEAEFSDVLTGKRDDRVGYQAMLARVRALRAEKRSCAVVVSALDRLGRKMLERVRSREELKSLGVATHSVREGGEVSDLTANILAAVAAEEIERNGMRVRNTWQHAKSLGWFKVSNAMPWGYSGRPATPEERQNGSPQTVLDVDPIAAPYVTELFERFAAGESAWSLARWASGLPAAVRGAWGLGRGRRTGEREMSRRGISCLLRNDVYAAEAPARWPALVKPETWTRVQSLLDDRRDAPRAQRTVFPLSGLVRCPCGAKACGSSQGSRRYRCQAPRSGGTCSLSFDAATVEAAVFAKAAECIESFLSADRSGLEKAWTRLHQAPPADDAKSTSQLEQRAAKARQRIGSATTKFVDGDLTKAAYDALVGGEQEVLESAESELAKLHSAKPTTIEVPDLDAVMRLVGDFRGAFDGADPLVAREVLAKLVTSITPVRIRRGRYEAAFVWTPLGALLATSRK